MKLHLYPELFQNTVIAAAQYLKVNREFIEKDYWITSLLQHLSLSEYADKTVFKGGTSLSKGFNLIKRFSEDVDIAIINEGADTGNQIKKAIRAVEKEMTTGLTEIKIDGITSKGSRFRKSVFEYPSMDKKSSNNKIIVEINSFANPFPYQEMAIHTMIYDFLIQTNNEKYIAEYGLEPFHLSVLNKEQTLIEKFVSLIRVSFSENAVEAIAGKIRHFYDLYYLMKDDECRQFLFSPTFKNEFLSILDYDRKTFDEPKGWAKHLLEESIIISNFPELWKQLKQKYQSELSALAYRSIPNETEVAEEINRLITGIVIEH